MLVLQLFFLRCHSLDIMVQQLATEIADLYKLENWSSEPQGSHGFVTALVSFQGGMRDLNEWQLDLCVLIRTVYASLRSLKELW